MITWFLLWTVQSRRHSWDWKPWSCQVCLSLKDAYSLPSKQTHFLSHQAVLLCLSLDLHFHSTVIICGSVQLGTGQAYPAEPQCSFRGGLLFSWATQCSDSSRAPLPHLPPNRARAQLPPSSASRLQPGSTPLRTKCIRHNKGEKGFFKIYFRRNTSFLGYRIIFQAMKLIIICTFGSFKQFQPC